MQFGVSESIAHWARYRPNTPAVCRGRDSISFGELSALINRVSHHLVGTGDLGERIGIAVSSKLDFLVSIVGVLRAGRSAVILNTGLPRSHLATNVCETGVRSIVYDPPCRASPS